MVLHHESTKQPQRATRILIAPVRYGTISPISVCRLGEGTSPKLRNSPLMWVITLQCVPDRRSRVMSGNGAEPSEGRKERGKEGGTEGGMGKEPSIDGSANGRYEKQMLFYLSLSLSLSLSPSLSTLWQSDGHGSEDVGSHERRRRREGMSNAP